MLVHDHKIETSEVFDFRETAPLHSTADMFTGLDDPDRKLVGNVTLYVYTPTCDPLDGWCVGWSVSTQVWSKLLSQLVFAISYKCGCSRCICSCC